ncbi:AI-2E family transporter [Portibacter lacus]|uniref:AI-2E family transporter n=1 Tax=Portibacter lacus TaxID=1099794 RepID=A0AA37WDA1_9BACT|nr:AI-2E family transporter [Portibacter lacus]GLR15732.1 AI-2E family transporter [Portibacter lacus]
MKNTTIQNLAYITIIIIGFGWLLYVGSGIVLPILFSCLFAIFLIPITKWFTKKIKLRWLAILLGFLCVILPVVLLFTIFSLQLVEMLDNIPSIAEKVTEGVDKVIEKIQNLNPFNQFDAQEMISNNIDNMSDGQLNTIGSGIVSSSEILLSTALTFLYTFLILFYKKSIKNFIIYQFSRYNRDDIKDTLLAIKETVQGYVTGLGIVVLILSTLNTLGLWLIGIEYPLFWGALAGVLAIVPYVGTFLGGLLPFLYSLSTSDSTWQPIAVIVYYAVIQQVEGNFITPKVVGNKVNINPLVAILSLIFFGSFWGIGGVILALPLISVIRIILEQFEETKAISMIMSADIKDIANKFTELPIKKRAT